MRVLDKIRSWFGGEQSAVETEAPAGRPKVQPVREAAGVNVDPDEENWRPLSSDARRDLTPVTQRRMQELAVYLWEGNLLANRLIELPAAYLLAEGVTLQVEDPEAKGWLQQFWNDPITKMDISLPMIVRELSLFGEQVLIAFVNEFDGHTRLGTLDPSLIETVVMDPDNSRQPIGIIRRPDKKGVKSKYRVIVNGPEDVFSQRTQAIRQTFQDGECFYFAVNQLSAGRRGRSDILPAMDWLDGYETFLFGELDRSGLMRNFIWDVTLTGATPAEVEAKARSIAAPKPNSVRVHNDQETWTSETPDLKAVDMSELARLFRNHVMGGSTIPEHWYGGGGDVNRSTAGEMGEPTFKMFSMRQKLVQYMLEGIANYVVLKRLQKLYGAVPSQGDVATYLVKAEFPEMTATDTTSYAAALQQVVAACALAIDRGLLSEETSLAIIASVAGRLGVKIDAAEELKTARAEASKRSEDDGFPDPALDPLPAEAA